tara:strand:+ start:1435 stop:1536 length:102 start_codon:yes stop_codon:yes gene_type:complete
MCVIPRRAASVIAAKISTGDRARAGERARADEQ